GVLVRARDVAIAQDLEAAAVEPHGDDALLHGLLEIDPERVVPIEREELGLVGERRAIRLLAESVVRRRIGWADLRPDGSRAARAGEDGGGGGDDEDRSC